MLFRSAAVPETASIALGTGCSPGYSVLLVACFRLNCGRNVFKDSLSPLSEVSLALRSRLGRSCQAKKKGIGGYGLLLLYFPEV